MNVTELVYRLMDRADELKMLAGSMDAPYIVPSTKETMALAMLSAASEMREAADTIEGLRDRLQGADVARNDADVLEDVAQALFRDLMRADPDMAGLWRHGWPELFGGAMERPMESEGEPESRLRRPQDEGCEYCGNGKKGFDGQTIMISNHGWQVIKHCPNCGKAVGR